MISPMTLILGNPKEVPLILGDWLYDEMIETVATTRLLASTCRQQVAG